MKMAALGFLSVFRRSTRILIVSMIWICLLSASVKIIPTQAVSQAPPNGQELESAWMTLHVNLTTSSPPPAGSLPDLAYYDSAVGQLIPSSSKTGDPGLSTQPYIGYEGYQSHNSYTALNEAITQVQFSGTASSFGSNTVSGGLNIHVPDTTYHVDYLIQLYSYVNSGGSTNIAWAIYSACGGLGFSCGPAYGNCSPYNCPVQSITIASGTVTSVGRLQDYIGVGDKMGQYLWLCSGLSGTSYRTPYEK